jgi:hypothetical protein
MARRGRVHETGVGKKREDEGGPGRLVDFDVDEGLEVGKIW